MNGNPYHLFASPRSPFARRIRLAMRRISLPHTESFVDVFQNPTELNAANPMGAVPVLMTPDFGPICDSTNILEYLHEKSGAIWPKDPRARTEVRQGSVLALGIIQASVLYYQEVHMHEVPSPRWAKDHVTVVEATLKRISETPNAVWMTEEGLTQAGWDLSTALEYISIRMDFIPWTLHFPALAEIVKHAREDAFFVESTPKL